MPGEWDYEVCRHERCKIPGVHPVHVVDERLGRPRKYDPTPVEIAPPIKSGRRRVSQGTLQFVDELQLKPGQKAMIFCPSCDGQNRSCDTCVGRGKLGYMHWLFLQGQRKNG